MPKRDIFIAGNWKMYKTTKEAAAFADAFKSVCLKDGIKTAICAPFTQLTTLKNIFEGSPVKVGAQNVHFEDEGAFTGEISVPMLTEIGVDYCIIGHSERREYFAETDETVNLKLKKLFLTKKIIPILCVGENLDQREAGREKDIVAAQIKEDLDGIAAEDIAKLVIAYEPIWAIGTGKTATPEQAQAMCGFIRETVKGLYGSEVSEQVLIQYGGSVKPENASEIMGMPDIDGALVGGASLDPEKFSAILDL